MTEPESTGPESEPEGDAPTESAGGVDREGAEAVPADGSGDGKSHESRSDGEAGQDTETDDEGSKNAECDDESEVDDALLERVRETDPESIAREIATLELEIDGLEAELSAREEEIDELTSTVKRKQADFENYKKRMKRRREEERKRATEGLVERLLDVRDNLQRALEQDEDVDIRDGVESTLRQFDDVLATEDVTEIAPEPGEEVDPHRHEVLARVEADVPEGTVADVHRPGYEMAGSVLREAQVTVGDGADGSEEGHDGAAGDPGADSAESGGDQGAAESGGD